MEASSPLFVLDISAIVGFAPTPGQLESVAEDYSARTWVSEAIADLLSSESKDDLAVILSGLNPQGTGDPGELLSRIEVKLRGFEKIRVSNQLLTRFYGEDAIHRMQTAVSATWHRLSPEASRLLSVGLLQELYAIDQGVAEEVSGPAALVSVSHRPTGEGPVKTVLRHFGRLFIDRLNPVMRKIGPAAADWEERKIAYSKRLMAPTRARLASDGLAIFVTIVVAVALASPIGSATWLIIRVGDFMFDGGAGAQVAPISRHGLNGAS